MFSIHHMFLMLIVVLSRNGISVEIKMQGFDLTDQLTENS